MPAAIAISSFDIFFYRSKPYLPLAPNICQVPGPYSIPNGRVRLWWPLCLDVLDKLVVVNGCMELRHFCTAQVTSVCAFLQ
jgi:hypothetical protein